MEFRVFNHTPARFSATIELADLLPFKSLVWEDTFDGIGKLQVVFAKSPDALNRIKVGAFGGIPQSSSLMYVHSVKYTDSEIWAYGYEVKALLQKMGAYPSPIPRGTQSIQTAINNALDYDQKYRYFAKVLTCDFDLGTANLDEMEYYTLYDFMQKTLRLSDAGLITRYNLQHTLDIVAVQSRDLSASVKFSPVLGNMSDYQYTVDNQSDIYSVTALGLATNGALVTSVYNGTLPDDGERTSAILDLRMEYPQPEGMSDADYYSALYTRAQMSQIARHINYKLTAKNVDTEQYGTAYRLGDYVGVALPELSVTAKMRVSKATYTCEGNNTKLALTLDKAVIG